MNTNNEINPIRTGPQIRLTPMFLSQFIHKNVSDTFQNYIISLKDNYTSYPEFCQSLDSRFEILKTN